MNDNNPYVLMQIEGFTDDLLEISGDKALVGTRLFYNIDPDTDVDDEIVDIHIVSSNETGEHPIFDQMRGKQIRVTIEIIE